MYAIKDGFAPQRVKLTLLQLPALHSQTLPMLLWLLTCCVSTSIHDPDQHGSPDSTADPTLPYCVNTNTWCRCPEPALA